MDNNETPDAIVKEIRSLVQEARKYPRDVEITTADVENWADRLEVAIARERNARINDIHNALYAATRLPGNAAAMRMALKDTLFLAKKYVAQSPATSAVIFENGRPVREIDYLQTVKNAETALAAPPRNCDQTINEAVHARNDFCTTVACADCPYSRDRSGYDCVWSWLFDTAKQKGGKKQ